MCGDKKRGVFKWVAAATVAASASFVGLSRVDTDADVYIDADTGADVDTDTGPTFSLKPTGAVVNSRIGGF